jgi:hypothetical protein
MALRPLHIENSHLQFNPLSLDPDPGQDDGLVRTQGSDLCGLGSSPDSGDSRKLAVGVEAEVSRHVCNLPVLLVLELISSTPGRQSSFSNFIFGGHSFRSL